MYELTNFISKRRAQEFRDPLNREDRILVSMTTPPLMGTPAVLNENSWKAILRLEFDDRDPSLMSPRERERFRLFDEADAIAILKFLKQHQDADVKHAICHCEAGISRSAAVAKFIALIYNLEFDERYSLYNKHVFSTLLKAHRSSLYGEGPLKVEEVPGILN